MKQSSFLEHNQNMSNDIINYSTLENNRSFPTTNETNNDENSIEQQDSLSTIEPTDSPILIMPYHEHQQQYSENATQSRLNTVHLTKINEQNDVYDAEMTIDITKCSTSLVCGQDSWNHLQPISKDSIATTSMLTTNQQQSSSIDIPTQTNYIEQYPSLINIHRPQTIYFSYPHKSNYTYQQISNTNTQINHESSSNNSYETNFFLTNVNHSNFSNE